MATTRTPGLTTDPAGNFFIDKCHNGTRICLRLGQTSLEQAERRLRREVAQADMERERRAHARPLLRDCAGRHERRSLEIVRAILNRAARSYRDAGGTPWLPRKPPLITMLPESRQAPYPITWAEQDRQFPRLPEHGVAVAAAVRGQSRRRSR